MQNLLGNVLSIQDILGKVNAAIAEEDNEAIVYQFGRFLRRITDFEPMKSASASSKDVTQGWMAEHWERTKDIQNPFSEGPFSQPTV